MEVRIRALGAEAAEVTESLLMWLEDDRDVAGHATITPVQAESAPGTMGPDIDTISLVVGTGFSVASLVLAFLSWRDSKAAPPAPVEITLNTTSIVIEYSAGNAGERIAKLFESGSEGV